MSYSHLHKHSHEHDHSGHSHAPEVSRDNEHRIFIAMLLTGGFMVAEVIGGLISGSLALIADAGHMATDTAALALAWFAFRLSKRPADSTRSYGFHRGEVLAAFVNGIAMIALVIWIVVEAVQRLYAPVEILGGIMLWIAIGGLLINCIAFWLLHTGSRENLNIRGAAVHVVGDLLGSVAAIITAGVIIWTGWTPIDPLLSLVVALLVFRSAWFITRQSAHILMEGAPPGLQPTAIKADLVQHITGLEDVHHVHTWSLTQERPLVILHARIHEDANPDELLKAVNKRMAEQFNVDHVTVQIEKAACTD
ncbi:MAG: cation transporter [Gammaproteobacteria bacterium]|nr:MAG: cation transporter [Gammaproteobacteria bacterium]RLA57814.1 MAG: cation transporter [Gammaproteobacteria bacterium]